ncbi:hypothetical protein Dsin_020012 [Dipteronia sinensis]|uniref:Uncharacterized protein n=1 Tax=Dipteronia sinensis TaxID=43782 RepID=A0AAE0A9T3_9ROSI|nr:hypothetical protein Dsin_020012 [Dipteronia sinensis]
MGGARMRLLVLALVLMVTVSSCLAAKAASKVDKWSHGRRLLFDEDVKPSKKGPIHTVGHVDDKGRDRGLVDNNEGYAKDGYPSSSNVNNHHYIPRSDFSQYGGSDPGGGSG